MQDEAQAQAAAIESVLERVRILNPAVADEFVAARNEMSHAAAALAHAFGGSEVDAMKWARGLRSQVVRIAVRWARARDGLTKAYKGESVLVMPPPVLVQE